MNVPIPFTENYQDLSTDKGFQFKFYCTRCGNGYMSSFQNNVTGMIGDGLRVVGDFFGGMFGKAADGAYEIQRAVGGQAHDGALRHAVEEISPIFKQCGRCGGWVCQNVCWNTARSQCVRCSPKLDEEVKAIESDATIQQLRNQSMQQDMKGGVELHTAAVSTQCPSCKAVNPQGVKFCEECGQSMQPKVATKCPQCGSEVAPGKKFCGECGTKIPAA
jgi:hypothetical protein